MFAYISGKLAQLEATQAIIDVGGVGYQIKISLHTFALLQQASSGSVKLFTYLQIQENAHNLFGFAELSERKLFLELISVSGIGAGTALVMLSSLSPLEIQQAIAQEEVKIIQSIKGIGQKTAQRVILELSDKMRKELALTGSSTGQVPHYRGVREEALLALTTLGLPKASAEKNIEIILKQQQGEALSLEELIKQALKM
jgi:Holliday junction DNA helicase RuvA